LTVALRGAVFDRAADTAIDGEFGRGVTRFIVLGDARTGSNLLVDALNSHPQIVCFREVLNYVQDFVDYGVPGYDDRDAEWFAVRKANPARFLRERIFSGHAETVRAAGFKLHYAHIWGFEPQYHGLFERVLDALTRDTALRVVHLQRRNLLRSLLSLRLAQATGIWMEGRADGGRAPLTRQTSRSLAQRLADRLRGIEPPVEPEEALPTPPGPAESIALDAADCAAHFARVEAEVARFNKLFAGHDMFTLSYEDLVSSPRAHGDVQRFLGVEQEPLTVALRRQHPQPMSQLISNFDELRRAFAGTPYRSFFREDDVR
jgi:LPS sulfotransferase NodH